MGPSRVRPLRAHSTAVPMSQQQPHGYGGEEAADHAAKRQSAGLYHPAVLPASPCRAL
jgi:hypothetical protein